MNGTLYAKIIQNCVVSLVPIENTIDEEFEAIFYDENQLVSEELFDEEQFETYKNDTIDLGEFGAQELAIGPYLPTKNKMKTKPFAALADIKQKK